MDILIKNTKVNYIKAGNPNSNISILLLHGASFSAQTWQDLGTIKILASKNYQVLAIDLPGYGKTSPIFGIDPADFLLTLITELNLNKPIIVAPSMSGKYSFPFIIKYPEKIGGFVAVAPVKIPHYIKLLSQINQPLPVLTIWGSNDRLIPLKNADLLAQNLKNVKQIILQNAGHPCYLNKPDEFHQELINFCENIS